MDDFFSTLYGIIMGDYENADKVARSEVNGYTIDTCDTVDAGYETAIWYEKNKMAIVERYPNKEQAKKGHEKWCDFCKTNPNSVWSVQLDREISLR